MQSRALAVDRHFRLGADGAELGEGFRDENVNKIAVAMLLAVCLELLRYVAKVRRTNHKFNCQGYLPDVSAIPNAGKLPRILTVSRLTVMTCPISRRIYRGSSARFGSFVMPLRLSVDT